MLKETALLQGKENPQRIEICEIFKLGWIKVY